MELLNRPNTGVSPGRLQVSDSLGKLSNSQPGINVKSPQVHTLSPEGVKKTVGIQSDNMNFDQKLEERRGMWS
jgi:hypothetical protein